MTTCSTLCNSTGKTRLLASLPPATTPHDRPAPAIRVKGPHGTATRQQAVAQGGLPVGLLGRRRVGQRLLLARRPQPSVDGGGCFAADLDERKHAHFLGGFAGCFNCDGGAVEAPKKMQNKKLGGFAGCFNCDGGTVEAPKKMQNKRSFRDDFFAI